jgi:hypothetical protein
VVHKCDWRALPCLRMVGTPGSRGHMFGVWHLVHNAAIVESNAKAVILELILRRVEVL